MNNFYEKLKQSRPHIKIIGDYINNKTKIKLKCIKCNHEWDALPLSFTKTTREPSDCPQCQNKIITIDSIKKRLKDLNPDIKILSTTYEHSKTPIKLKCIKCNYEWDLPYYKMFAKDRSFPVCQNCSSRLKVSHYDFVENCNNEKVSIVGQFENYQNKVLVKCNCCNHEWEQLPSNIKTNTGCPICALKTSKYEQEIFEYLESLNIKNIIRNKIFTHEGLKREIDIYLPDFNFGIDFHGLYWHSEIHKEKNYHLQKLEMFQKLNINIIQIFENEWLTKKEQIKYLLKRKLKLIPKIGARKCKISEIDTTQAKMFCEKYHLHGYVGGSIRLGLFYCGELTSLIVVGHSRFDKNYELIRYCVSPNYVVIGGLNKMLSYLFKHNNINDVFSFIDRRYFTGDSYKHAGFSFEGYTPIGYWYFEKNKPHKLYHRAQFQKHKLKHLLQFYDENQTEHANMLNHNFYRIYDCGNIRVKKSKP